MREAPSIDVGARLSRLAEGSEHERRAAGYVREYVAGTVPHQWEAPSLALWLDRLEERGLSPASINRRLSAVLSVWRWMHRRGWPTPPPAGLYRREAAGRRRVLSPEEEPRLLAALAEPYRTLASFLLASGLRVSEALALRPGTVADVGGSLSVKVLDSKNGDARVVPGVPLWKWPGPDLFQGISQSAFNHAWAAARASMGLADDPEFVPHMLRHTYATRLVVAGVPLSVVARLLGHRTVRTTMRYSHVSDADAERWVRQVSERPA